MVTTADVFAVDGQSLDVTLPGLIHAATPAVSSQIDD